MDRLRLLGYDETTGKRAFASAAPGGLLEAMADRTTIDAGTALHALVSTILDNGQATEGELAALVAPLVTVLGELVQMATRDDDEEAVTPATPLSEYNGSAFSWPGRLI